MMRDLFAAPSPTPAQLLAVLKYAVLAPSSHNTQPWLFTISGDALELYAEVFEAAGALKQLEAFASHFGADFYRLPRNRDSVTLVKEPWTVSGDLAFGDDTLVPLRAGETVAWKLVAPAS